MIALPLLVPMGLQWWLGLVPSAPPRSASCGPLALWTHLRTPAHHLMPDYPQAGNRLMDYIYSHSPATLNQLAPVATDSREVAYPAGFNNRSWRLYNNGPYFVL